MKTVAAISLLILAYGTSHAEEKVLSLEGNWFYPKFYINGEWEEPRIFRKSEFLNLLDSKEESSEFSRKYRRYKSLGTMISLFIPFTAKSSDDVLERLPITLALVSGISWFNHRHLLRAVDAYNQPGVKLTYGITESGLGIRYTF